MAFKFEFYYGSARSCCAAVINMLVVVDSSLLMKTQLKFSGVVIVDFDHANLHTHSSSVFERHLNLGLRNSFE